ncbi:hypothetical protein ES705_34675 [subsurface metagenome]
MPGKIIVPHHSVTDWDFEQADEHHSLSEDEFISAPTSLRLYNADTSAVEVVLCRIPATLVLPQGEVRTWQYAESPVCRPAVFRNQAALGTSNYQNMYEMLVYPNEARFSYYSAGSPHTIDTHVCIVPAGQWNHWRVFWYNGETPGEEEAICVDLYLEIHDEWQKQGATFYHTLNLWKDSAINRCGFRQNVAVRKAHFWDNTEIWGPV